MSDNLQRLVALLQHEFAEASRLQAMCVKESELWWWAEGRKMATETCLLQVGVDPDGPPECPQVKAVADAAHAEGQA